MRKKVILGILVALLCVGRAFAETTIKAEVDKLRISTDDALTYKLTVSSTDKNVPQPQVPSFEGFQVISQAQSSTVSFMQNGPKAVLIYIYILAPQKTGKLTIQPSRITVQGKPYTSEPFDIEVVQGKTVPQPEGHPALPEGVESKEPQVTL